MFKRPRWWGGCCCCCCRSRNGPRYVKSALVWVKPARHFDNHAAVLLALAPVSGEARSDVRVSGQRRVVIAAGSSRPQGREIALRLRRHHLFQCQDCLLDVLEVPKMELPYLVENLGISFNSSH